MAEGGTTADFARWVEPHLTALARYAARRVGPDDRDRLVHETLARAWQRWPAYDASRGTAVGWLLGLMARASTREGTPGGRAVVELVEHAGTALQTRDVDLERAVAGLGRRERQVVDLHAFVGLDLASVAEVTRTSVGGVETALAQASAQLGRLVGDDAVVLMPQRLASAGRRWQADQPPPPEVALDRLDDRLPRRLPLRRIAVVAAVLVVVAGSVAVVSGLGHDGGTPPAAAAPGGSSGGPSGGPDVQPRVDPSAKIVPFRDLEPGHPTFGRPHAGAQVTPFDHVSASGTISGSVHPGDRLEFDAVLTSPGLVSLRPCPDYTITVGGVSTTRRLNCAQVPYYASLVRSSGRVTSFRPVLPAGTQVSFRMRVTVPDRPGRQQVSWALDGPTPMPGFSGLVDVAAR
jgi:RNA polymerase sigma-70 factor (ECF subfamily)